MIVIVSKQAYLICEQINYIVINEVQDDGDESWSISSSRKKKLPTSAKQKREYIKLYKPYQIVIDFVSATGNNPNNQRQSLGGGTTENVRITVNGLENTVALYTEIVEQIREQMPDVLYVDKLVERFLATREKSEP